MGSSPPSGGAKEVDARRGESASAGRGIITLVGGVLVGAVVATAAILIEPATDPDAAAALIVAPSTDADATLQPTGIPPDDLVLRLLEPPEATHLEMDLATLRGFGEHDGIDVWTAYSTFGSPCIIAIHRQTSDVIGTSCVPVGTTTFVDTLWHGLPPGAAYRFTLREDAVDVHLLLPTEAP
jgi:hypothetical protein